MLYQQRSVIFHDIKNHLVILSSLMDEEEFNKARQYIKKIQEPIKALDQRRYTENRIINSIINDKDKKATLYGVSLNIKVIGDFMTAIEDIDWCAILANLLDNAIEACEKVPVEERKIDFSLVQKNEMIILNISNPYCGTLKLMDGKLRTLKEDKLLHGIGLESVKYAVDKNNGTMEYSFMEHIFRVTIVLLPQKGGEVMRENRDSFMVMAGDLDFELETVKVGMDTVLEEWAVTTNTSILSIFCC